MSLLSNVDSYVKDHVNMGLEECNQAIEKVKKSQESFFIAYDNLNCEDEDAKTLKEKLNEIDDLLHNAIRLLSPVKLKIKSFTQE